MAYEEHEETVTYLSLKKLLDNVQFWSERSLPIVSAIHKSWLET